MSGRYTVARAGSRRVVISSRPPSQSPAALLERQRVALLAEQVHLVAGPHERLRQRAVVDVRAGPGQQSPWKINTRTPRHDKGV